MKNADPAVGHLAKRLVMGLGAGSNLVVVAAGSRRRWLRGPVSQLPEGSQSVRPCGRPGCADPNSARKPQRQLRSPLHEPAPPSRSRSPTRSERDDHHGTKEPADQTAPDRAVTQCGDRTPLQRRHPPAGVAGFMIPRPSVTRIGDVGIPLQGPIWRLAATTVGLLAAFPAPTSATTTTGGSDLSGSAGLPRYSAVFRLPIPRVAQVASEGAARAQLLASGSASGSTRS